MGINDQKMGINDQNMGINYQNTVWDKPGFIRI
jgi:hypothetical protein